MDRSRCLRVHLCKDGSEFSFPLDAAGDVRSVTCEDVCTAAARSLQIGNAARHLYGLRDRKSHLWLAPNHSFQEYKDESPSASPSFEFRQRFRVPSVAKLKRADSFAFDYYFHQVREDFLQGSIAGVSDDKSHALGLVTADMYRAMLERGLKREEVESDYKRFVPRDILRKEMMFVNWMVRKKLETSLAEVEKHCKRDASYVKAQYLEKMEEICPGYLSEEYRAQEDKGSGCAWVKVKVEPRIGQEPGIKLMQHGTSVWDELCAIEDLCSISMRNDCTVEISRKNGIPSYLKFSSTPQVYSFVSLLDGYYRLIEKWTFNLCRELPTPSLQRLRALKSHGPISGEFSYTKLKEKRDYRLGSFILRESNNYDEYFIDVCHRDRHKPITHCIRLNPDGRYYFTDGESVTYTSIAELLLSHRNVDEDKQFAECLPPSEYDKSSLLLCLPESKEVQPGIVGVARDSQAPQCVSTRSLQIYRGKGLELSGRMCTVHRAMWKPPNGTVRREVALKVLKSEHRQKHGKEFLELLNRAVFWNGNGLVCSFGVVLASPLALVSEFLPLGRLDLYLQGQRRTHGPTQGQNMEPDQVELVDLVEAAAHLSRALRYLHEDQMMSHGKIRCQKVLVAAHTDSEFRVKLADPGLSPFDITEAVHWIPPELHASPSLARYSTSSDIWAYGTLLWEMFSYGRKPWEAWTDSAGSSDDAKKFVAFYARGGRLLCPESCPQEIYQLMRECWVHEPQARKQPQAIMRDVNQMLYSVFNSRQKHSYATVYPQVSDSDTTEDVQEVDDQLFSTATASSFLTDDTYAENAASQDLLGSLGSSAAPWMDFYGEQLKNGTTTPSGVSSILSHMNFNGSSLSLDSMASMQEIFLLENSQVEVYSNQTLGEGFYGKVYRGVLKQNDELVAVAVKKLKDHGMSSGLQDLQREIAIMKSLRHPNIVEIKGMVEDPETLLVMEFVPQGSLLAYLRINRDSLTNQQLLKFALDVSEGMEYLGKRNIVHRDLAARNILVVSEDQVKISDFGLAQFVGSNHYYVMKTERDLPLRWYAPESIRFGRFSTQSDVWSYGVTLYEMFSRGEEPSLPRGGDSAKDETEVDMLERGVRLGCHRRCPGEVYAKIMLPCWEADSHARPTFTRLKALVQEVNDM